MPKMEDRRIQVLLTDDHPAVRRELGFLINSELDMQVIGEAGDGLQAIEQVRQLLPDVIVMDVSMPNINGIDATRIISVEYPAIRIIGLSMSAEPEIRNRMLQAGATDYVSKSGPVDAILTAIRKAVERNYPKEHAVVEI